VCGDGILHYTEQCDDGNTNNGDTCTYPDCRIAGLVCGDGVRGPAEQCDDGNTVSYDGCRKLHDRALRRRHRGQCKGRRM
jgi:cysteine-rich repeat protein